MTPERIAELRSILKEGVRTDRPMKNFMNIYGAANGLSEALDAIERVRAFCADHGDGSDLPYPESEVWENAIAHVLAALEGKGDG